MPTSEFKYFAFISYKREDEKWAKLLQTKLESYSLPTVLRKEKTKPTRKISIDRFSFLGHTRFEFLFNGTVPGAAQIGQED